MVVGMTGLDSTQRYLRGGVRGGVCVRGVVDRVCQSACFTARSLIRCIRGSVCLVSVSTLSFAPRNSSNSSIATSRMVSSSFMS